MLQFRIVLVRLRAGDTAREIARSSLLGRDKISELQKLAQAQGWLDAGQELPDDAAIAAALTPRKSAASTLAKETGLIAPLGRWVLERACHQQGSWRWGWCRRRWPSPVRPAVLRRGAAVRYRRRPAEHRHRPGAAGAGGPRKQVDARSGAGPGLLTACKALDVMPGG